MGGYRTHTKKRWVWQNDPKLISIVVQFYHTSWIFFVGTIPTQIQAIDSNGFNLDRLNKFSELPDTSKRSQRIKRKKKRSSILSASRQMSRRQCIFYRQGGCNLFLLSFSTINVMFSSKNKNNKYHIFHLKFQTLFSSFFSFVI